MTNKRLLYCYSFQDFEKRFNGSTLNPDDAIISIIGSEDIREDYERHIFQDADNVLNLAFDDVTDRDLHIAKVKLFDARRAQLCAKYIEKHVMRGSNFFIHCAAGQSRSQAFVKYILDTYPEIEWETRKENPCKFPNYYVAGLLKQAYKEIKH